jgi:hypothetical protein
MTVTKVFIIEEHKSMVICCGEIQPSDTKVVINGGIIPGQVKFPNQKIYTPEDGFDPAPGSRDMFSICWTWRDVTGWAPGDPFKIVNSVESHEVSNYGSGFGNGFVL